MMKLKVKILSGILGLAMLLPFTGVRAEDEFSAEVAIMMQKIEKVEKNVVYKYIGMELWDVYLGLVRAYKKYGLRKEILEKFYNVLSKLKYTVESESITNLKLIQAINVLCKCYVARMKELDTDYLTAHAAWKEAYEICCSLDSMMKFTKYSYVFSSMLKHCENHMKICIIKESSSPDCYRIFFGRAVNVLEKMYEKPIKKRSQEEISGTNDFELEVIYELLEPIRMFEAIRVKSPLKEFMAQLDQVASSMKDYMYIFDKKDKLLEFTNRLETKIDELIKSGDNFKKHEKYSEAMKAYFGARVILDYAIQIRNQEDYYLLVDSAIKCRIEKCERCMERLGEGTLF